MDRYSVSPIQVISFQFRPIISTKMQYVCVCMFLIDIDFCRRDRNADEAATAVDRVAGDGADSGRVRPGT